MGTLNPINIIVEYIQLATPVYKHKLSVLKNAEEKIYISKAFIMEYQLQFKP
jgi:hypothetical protein